MKKLHEILFPIKFQYNLLVFDNVWVNIKASLLGILANSNDICLYDLECLEKSSKHIVVSKPLSLNI